MIRLHRVSKTYDGGESFAVKAIDLHVQPGELLILLGASGCGKTTTLKMINRLIEMTDGSITLDGQSITGVNPVTLRRRIGYVFQGIGLFPHLTVGENVAVVPKMLGWSRRAIDRRVDELLELVGLSPEEYGGRWPASLSGGQRQRVGVARALAARPRVMLMDEPFGALDPITRDALQEQFTRIHRDLELTTMMVTHDMTEALLMADRIAVMDGGEVLRVGTPHELMTDPGHEYVERLMQTPKKQADRLEALAAASPPPARSE